MHFVSPLSIPHFQSLNRSNNSWVWIKILFFFFTFYIFHSHLQMYAHTHQLARFKDCYKNFQSTSNTYLKVQVDYNIFLFLGSKLHLQELGIYVYIYRQRVVVIVILTYCTQSSSKVGNFKVLVVFEKRTKR